MKQFAFPLGDKPALTIRSHADLQVTGWDRPDASVDSEPGYSLKVEQGRTGLFITCLEDCEIFIPTQTLVTIEKVSGDLKISNLTGTINIQKVGGSAVFATVGTVAAEKIGGDCDVSGIAGNFTVEKIGGSLEGSQFAGDVLVEKAGGDVRAGGIAGRFIARAGGSIEAQLLDGFGPAVTLRAGGDIRLHLPARDAGHYVLISGSEEICLNLAGLSNTVENKYHEFTRGERSQIEVELRSGGSLTLTAEPFEESAFVQHDTRADRPERVSAGGWEGISRSTEEAINRAARSAEEALRQAERRVTAALRGLEGRGQVGRGAGQEDVIIPPAPREQPATPGSSSETVEFVPAGQAGASGGGLEMDLPDSAVVTDQERLLILKMLQDKKITIEEAEALFEALGHSG